MMELKELIKLTKHKAEISTFNKAYYEEVLNALKSVEEKNKAFDILDKLCADQNNLIGKYENAFEFLKDESIDLDKLLKYIQKQSLRCLIVKIGCDSCIPDELIKSQQAIIKILEMMVKFRDGRN